MDFVKLFRIDGLDYDGILSTDEMYKFLVRVAKNGIFFTKNMSNYSITFLCMLLTVSCIFIMSRLTCRGLVPVVAPFISAIIGPYESCDIFMSSRVIGLFFKYCFKSCF